VGESVGEIERRTMKKYTDRLSKWMEEDECLGIIVDESLVHSFDFSYYPCHRLFVIKDDFSEICDSPIRHFLSLQYLYDVNGEKYGHYKMLFELQLPNIDRQIYYPFLDKEYIRSMME
jgi:hypothetical protein